MTELEGRIAEWAAGEENVRAAALVGSRARVDVPADEWSDFNIVLFARDPAALLVRDDWVATFGRPRLTFLEPTAVGEQLERRVLYEDGTDVDFAIVPVELLDHPAVAHVASRGIRVLVDKDGELGSRLAELPEPAPPSPPNEAALRELAADFFYHAVWAARKLRRGEVFTAKRCVDSYMENVLIRILEWRTHAENPNVDTWHAGRFIERWADPATLEEFRGTFAAYDEADVRRALFASMDFFRRGPGDGRPPRGWSTRRRGRVRHERRPRAPPLKDKGHPKVAPDPVTSAYLVRTLPAGVLRPPAALQASPYAQNGGTHGSPLLHTSVRSNGYAGQSPARRTAPTPTKRRGHPEGWLLSPARIR